MYISMRVKFYISLAISLSWTLFSLLLAIPWAYDLYLSTNSYILSWSIICGITTVPGFLNAFLITSVLLDKQPEYKVTNPFNEVTILIAAYNEESCIYRTLSYISKLAYNGNIKVIVVDNNSSDNTYSEVIRAKNELYLDLIIVSESNQGKFNALNTGLKHVTTEYFITLDADTILHKYAINNLICRILSTPKGKNTTAAVAGSVLVSNSRDSTLARMQEWDYFLSIAGIKRMQGMYQSTLVAQGAFSGYDTSIVREIGGWPDSIGEDIVLTWKMLEKGYKVYYEPFAVAFTDVPSKLSHFIKQRSRWARGMIEGIREVKPWNQKTIMSQFTTGMDFLLPYIDFSYTFFWTTGVILALFFKNYIIVGIMTLLVLPLTCVSFYVLFSYQKKHVFDKLGLKVRANKRGLVLFILGYQLIMSPVSLYGYVQELFRFKRTWK